MKKKKHYDVLRNKDGNERSGSKIIPVLSFYIIKLGRIINYTRSVSDKCYFDIRLYYYFLIHPEYFIYISSYCHLINYQTTVFYLVFGSIQRKHRYCYSCRAQYISEGARKCDEVPDTV